MHAMTPDDGQKKRYREPQLWVRSFRYEYSILSVDVTITGSGGENAEDEPEPGF